jgi:hypothetical protein
MRFNVIGASAESGDDIDVMLEAKDQADVERIAHDKGILVSSIRVASENEDRSIELILDDANTAPAAADDGTRVAVGPVHEVGHVAHAGGGGHASHAGVAIAPEPHHHAHGKIITNAGSPSDTVHVGEGHIDEAKKADVGLEYHILLNQSLYLLETAVNKYIKDGWEPQGGLTVGMSNNALQYFQAIIRRHRPPGAKAVEPNKPASDAG